MSGGNQQKVVLAKWLATEPRLLIIDEPTRGIDVGTKAEVHRLLSELAAEGVAVLMISSELPEVLGMADRVLVICEGRLTAELARDDADAETVMRRRDPCVHATEPRDRRRRATSRSVRMTDILVKPTSDPPLSASSSGAAIERHRGPPRAGRADRPGHREDSSFLSARRLARPAGRPSILLLLAVGQTL